MVVRLDRMTTHDVQARLSAGKGIVVLPLGATEQHGPHCPLGTDSFCAEVVAEQVALDLDAVLAPALPYGDSTPHLNFPGSITLTPSTLALVVKELCGSLADSGFTFIVVVNGNNPNLPAILTGAREAQLVKPIAIAVSSYWDALRDTYTELVPSNNGATSLRSFNGHGGIMETSLSMVYAEDSVQMDRVISGPVDNAILIADPTLQYVTRFEDYSRSGVLGDASHASVELGRRIAQRAGHAIAERARLLQKTFAIPVPAGGS
jgi:creatinine amidohydrolase/Fe(II)-dependent formamide hydrolase-like protein